MLGSLTGAAAQLGLEVNWRHTFGLVQSHSIGAILILGLFLLGIFVAWLAAADVVYQKTLGVTPGASVGEFLRQVLTSTPGATLLIVGNAVGFVFALVAFAISVVSFPMLVDQNVSVFAAVKTSVRAVLRNPVPMLSWGFFVAAVLAIGSLPFLLGLAVVVPILGHATWHLYRRVVVL